MIRKTTRLVTAAVAAGILSSMMLVSPAAAFPSGCDVELAGHTDGYSAYCSGGTGQFRVRIDCDKPNWPDYTRWSPWTTPGTTTSAVWCDKTTHRAYNPTLQLLG
ncbi:hypothetical protein JIG36_01770 [Actinoplanes sp. LDG1-06]|uniref:Secreted protein n=1 Tax=Paractinoplanes ovalisporus TaxID=2810368 RepID=A0ABS2A378_9ACTN|nr:hypothetical protein [Actinoplanes ovalisporus]MBM2614282.1 hypothetical protein [Actinoplanes ovalisporus]